MAQPRSDFLGGVIVLKINRSDDAEPVTAIPYPAGNTRSHVPIAVWLKRLSLRNGDNRDIQYQVCRFAVLLL